MNIFSNEEVYIIAEAGVNHNGSFDAARELVDKAVEAGANAVKFQSFIPELLVSKSAPKAQYQINTTGNTQSQLEMLQNLALSFEQQEQLFLYCLKNNIDFLSTPFDMPSQHFLCETLNLPLIKIGSGDVTNGPLLLAVAEAQKSIILSTGMCSVEEIKQALMVIAFGYSRARCEQPGLAAFETAFLSDAGQAALRKNVFLLQCTTEYPCPYEDINLRAMDFLAEQFTLPVGLSDHSNGISVAIAAVARGARIIEKHFTLDRTMPGPDHKASLEPDELTQLVKSIRQVEVALGKKEKTTMQSELNNKAAARKYLVASKPIQRGEYFTAENLTAKRAGSGISPMQIWALMRQKAKKDYAIDEIISI